MTGNKNKSPQKKSISHDNSWLLEYESSGLAQSKPTVYGDVTELNTERTILDSVGRDMLKLLSEDIMALLDTSVAVYEKNGDYAFVSFVSEYCSLMDKASRDLCNTDDNQKALDCGRWLYHENSWNLSAKAAMESNKITDIACIGGIHLYGIPIRAGEDIVGAINMGYGNPPTDEKTLEDLSCSFDCDIELLRNAAKAFNSRPPFLIEIAKRRLQSIAMQIGKTVEAAKNKELLNDLALFPEENKNPVLRINSEMQLLYANTAAKKLIDEQGCMFGDKISAQWHSIVQAVWADGATQTYNIPLGDKVYSFIATPIKERGYINIYATDITDRKQTEEKLKASEEKLKELALFPEENQNPVLRIDSKMRLLYANPAAMKIVMKTGCGIGEKVSGQWQPLMKETWAEGTPLIHEVKIDDRVYTFSSSPIKDRGYINIYVTDITKRKQNEKKLMQSEALLKSSLESSKDIIMLSIDTDYKYLYFNQVHTRTMAYLYNTVPELGKSMLKLITKEEDLVDVKLNFKKAFAGESHMTIQEFGKSSARSYFETKYNPIYEDGKVIGASLFSSNITERIQADEALRASEEMMRSSQSVAHICSYSTNLNINEIEKSAWVCSLEFYKIFGIDKTYPHTIEGWVNFIHPDYRKEVFDYHKSVAKEKKPFNREYKIIRINDGAERWVHCTGELDFDEKGTPIRIHGAIQDITESKKADLTLSAEKENLAVTLRSIGDGVITTDTEGNIVMLNKVAEELTGWPSKEAIGHPLPEVFNIINEKTRKKCENPVEKVLATGSIIELENHTCLIAEDGREIIIADSGAPIRNKESQIIGVVLVFRDMTEKQKLEEAFQNSQKLESLGILAGGIAHDFNNILGAIFGYTELAMLKTEEGKVSSFLAKSLSSIDRARALTEQLLTFAKGGAPIKNVENLFPFVQETTQFALSGSSVSSRFQIQENLWACDFDKNKIGQVIDNLTINAQQAMPMGGTILVSAINISLSEKEHIPLPSGNYVKLSIKDQGIGIPKEFLTNIFDPYYTTKPNGHGLGLATCYSIIKRHNGCIEVESEPGQGSTFHIYLPAAINPVAELANKSKDEHKGSGTFLVMDDEETNREIMKDLLKSFGYTVVLKENGQDAVDFFVAETNSSRKIAGMIFDLTIPGGLGGKDAIGEIRKMDSETPAFVASGYSTAPVMANPEEYGFNASLCKPFMKDELSDMLEKHMKGK